MVEMRDQEKQALRFEIRLLIRHPTIDPQLITERLGLSPTMSRFVGEQRRTPSGTILEGTHKNSTWGWSTRVEQLRFFSKEIVTLLNLLEAHTAFISELVDGGGTISTIINLAGDENIGDVIPWPDLARLAALKVNLGIEVFPNFD